MQAIVNGAVLAAIYAIFALGMSLVWSSIGLLNFAHGSVFMFSGFVAYLISEHMRLSFVLSLAVGAAAGAILSVAIDSFALRPTMRRAASLAAGEMQILIVGIGAAGLLTAIADHVTAGNPFGLQSIGFRTKLYHWGPIQITDTQALTLLVAIGLSTAIIVWLRISQTGLALRSIGVDPATASLMGVNRAKLSTATFAFAGATAGIACILLIYQLGAIGPDIGETFVLKAFAAIILGGVGSVLGTVIGCGILAVCEEVVLTRTDGQWVDAVSLGLIILVLLIRPNGLLGRRDVTRS